MSWSAILSNYAKLRDPERELPAGVLLEANDETLTIFDGYEKAKYHFLVLPRDPFPLHDASTQRIASSQLDSLSSLMKSPHKLQVLRALERQANKVKDMIRDEMEKVHGFHWPVHVGFHAVESMKHVHLHVISSDMISDRLKNKKHWNSFDPNLGFFLHLSDVIHAIETTGSFRLEPVPRYEALLKRDLEWNGETFKNLPQLKKRLVDRWNDDKNNLVNEEDKGQRIRNHSNTNGETEVAASRKRESSPAAVMTASSSDSSNGGRTRPIKVPKLDL